METTNLQRTSWHSSPTPTASWPGSGFVESLGLVISKTANAWLCTPKALKLPLETAALLYAPSQQTQAAAAVLLLAETPKNLAAFLINQPVKLFGERWQLFGSLFPTDPKQPLTNLDKKIGMFERAQPPLLEAAPPLQPTDALQSAPIDPTLASNMEKITDKNLEVLIEKISYFTILKAMHSYCGVPENDANPLLSLVDEASRTKRPSLWKIFTRHYGSQMGVFGRIKAGFIYLFLWNWLPIIPKTVDAYLKNVLSELRINLKENGEKRKKFINGLLDDADNFFEVYNGATETYANDGARKGNLNHYRQNAIDLMLPREDLNLGKTPKEQHMAFYRKLSASIVDHFSPKAGFGPAEKLLNYWIERALRDHILPEVFLNITDEGQEATKRHNIPFFLALTKTLTAQISKMEGSLEKEPTDSSSLHGIKNFEAIVKKFLWAIDMAECKTVEEVRAKSKALKQPETGLDAQMRSGIQLGIQKGLALFFDYLSKQENTEELFATLFESVATPFSGHLPMNDKQWAEIAIEYDGAKILLKQAASALSKQIVHTAIQDKVRGGAIPEATERAAQKIFAEHKTRGQKTFEELLRVCDKVQDKLIQPKCDLDEASIYPELAEIASLLKAFENKERVKIAIEQDPPPQIATLAPADQETILRVLYPLYEGANELMDIVLRLQKLQKAHAAHTKIAHELKQIRKTVEEVVSKRSPAASLDQIDHLMYHFNEIEAIDPTAALHLRVLKEQIHSIGKSLQQIASDQRALDALANLQPFPGGSEAHTGLIDQLLLCVRGKAPTMFRKWKCIEQIKQNVKAAGFNAPEKQKIFDLIDKMGHFNSSPEPRPNFTKEIWEPLAALLNGRKLRLEENQKQIASALERSIPQAYLSSGALEQKADHLSQRFWKEMQRESARLQNDASKLRTLIESAKKEQLLQLSTDQLGQICGSVGFLLGLGVGTISPEAGSVVGAVAAAGLANLGSLAKGKWVKFSIPVLGSAAAAGLATRHFAQIAQMPMPALIGAIGASAGLEYFGANVTKRVIDTGIDVAMPKVTEVFDAAYEHLLTSDIVINGGFKILMKQVIDLFPPKK